MSSKYSYVYRSIEKRRAWFNSLKEDQPCDDCGEKFPTYCMDYHHIVRSTKKFPLAYGSYRNSRSKILEEIKKCVLLCAICHRIREHNLRDGEMESRNSHKV